jgi:hypothetical protein
MVVYLEEGDWEKTNKNSKSGYQPVRTASTTNQVITKIVLSFWKD